MNRVQPAALPDNALLMAYRTRGDHADCYEVTVPQAVTLAGFMAAFYTSPAFKLERWLLAHLSHFPSTDEQAHALARGERSQFAAWQVESRMADQAVLAAGRTRSWFMVAPLPDGSGTRLRFGSAVVQRKRGGMGWAFGALLGFHKLYSRILLTAAARRLQASPRSLP
ncbi:MAG: hypothetical protein KF871_08900 [Hydrogenophaga sp.]|uniref:hypothetical protein n=1 Tax=Hydrogenophaga sp. TaxID=1904254 RepID=UPI001D63A57D|nr:hypothetical protein [Hydrogenophaga sp.]MBX3610005.1 hypothetical protein [Hydrogenophaga sp.]